MAKLCMGGMALGAGPPDPILCLMFAHSSQVSLLAHPDHAYPAALALTASIIQARARHSSAEALTVPQQQRSSSSLNCGAR